MPVQRPFLRDFAEFSRLLRPGVRNLRISLPVLNGAVSRGVKVLPRTVQMNRDLEGALREVEELVDAPRASFAAGALPGQTATLTSLQRLSTLFDSIDSAGSKIIPAQTVCSYWNYWFTYIPEHFAGRSQFGFGERLIGPGFPGTTTPDEFPRNPLSNYAGGAADGRYSDIYDRPITPAKDPPAGLFDPLFANDSDPADEVAQPIVRGSAYGPVGTDAAPNCQSGQVGAPIGELLAPGQPRDNPAIGPYDISQATGGPLAGRTDLFLRQNGVREFWDSP